MKMHIAPVLVAVLGTAAAPASAQPAPEPQRPPLRDDLRAAGEKLANHPHPYMMSEEVARTRLQKQGLQATDLKPASPNTFEAQVLKNGQPVKIQIDRLNGTVRKVE